MELTEFLTRRLESDWAWAETVLGEPEMSNDHGIARRMLREVDAKRRIVSWYTCDPGEMCPQHGPEYHQLFRAVLNQLAAVYSDHPDYDPAWT